MKKLSERFLEVSKYLENLNDTFVIKGIPDEYKKIWVPNNEIKLWQIPRTSAKVLRAFALSNNSKTVLELGTSAGYSGMWLASAVEENQGKVYTVELAKPKIDMAAKTFKDSGLENSVQQIEGKVSDVLKDWNKQIDMVFLDADKMNYLLYIKKFEKFLRKGSVVIADNATDFGDLMEDYIEYVSNNQNYHSFLLDIDNGLMVSIRL
jgi:predicted O-methyltransferase YrrM